MNNQKENKKRLGALDVFIIIALIACMVSVGLRFISVRNSDVSQSTQLDNYTLSFKVYNIRESSAVKFMSTGTKFFLHDTDAPLGTLMEGKVIQPGEKFYELSNGDIVPITNTSTGDLYRVDVDGSFQCQGIMNSDGSFLLNGNKYIGVNQEIKIYSKYLLITIKVTDINKA